MKRKLITLALVWVIVCSVLVFAKHVSKGKYVDNNAPSDPTPVSVAYEDPDDTEEDSSENEPEEDEQEQTILLSSLPSFQGNLELDDKYAYGFADNLGESGDYRARLYKSDHDETSNYVVKRIEKKYSKLVFKAGLYEECKDAKNPVWISVTGDGRPVGQTKHFKSGEEPETYEFDVRGIDKLRIEVDAAMYFSLIDGGNVSNDLLVSDMYLIP